MKIIEILEINLRIMKIIKNQSIQRAGYDNHENVIQQREYHENHENINSMWE